MHRRFSLVLTLFAWLLATGGQWDLVQTFAWSRMMVNYAGTMPLTQAVKKTFSGEQCEICVTVQEAKREQTTPSGTAATIAKAAGKVLLVFPPANVVFAEFVPMQAGLIPAVLLPGSAERATPPSPPPRLAA